MPFKSISRHQPSQREPKLSWPSLTGKSLRVCRYHQNKTPQRSLLPKQQQSSNPRQQKAPRPLDVAGTGINFQTLSVAISISTYRSHHPKHASPTVLRHFMALQALKKAVRYKRRCHINVSLHEQHKVSKLTGCSPAWLAVAFAQEKSCWISLRLPLQKLKLKTNHVTEQIQRILKNVNPSQIFAYKPCNAELISKTWRFWMQCSAIVQQ